MTTWGAYLNRVRAVYLRDVEITGDPSFGFTFPDDQILECYRLAVDSFADFHAPQKSVFWNSSTPKLPSGFYDMSVDRRFPIPADSIDDVEFSGRVSVERGGRLTYLETLRTTSSGFQSNRQGFYVFNNELVITYPMAAGDTLHLEYFAYYSVPDDDLDVIEIPRWAEGPVGLLIVYHALVPMIIRGSENSEYKTKPESGTPEQNPWIRTQNHVMKQYEMSFLRRARQDRTNMARGRDDRG